MSANSQGSLSRAEQDLLAEVYRVQVAQLRADGVVAPFKARSAAMLDLANGLADKGFLTKWTEADDIFPRYMLTARGVLRCMAHGR